MLEVIHQYQIIKERITHLLDISGYRNDYIAKKIGMSPSAFAVKKQRKSWTDKEVQEIIEVITHPNEDVEEYIMMEIMRGRDSEPDLTMADYQKLKAKW